MKNWKTTSAGIAMIAGALIMLWFEKATLTPEKLTGAITALLGGVGLVFSKDYDKTGLP